MTTITAGSRKARPRHTGRMALVVALALAVAAGILVWGVAVRDDGSDSATTTTVTSPAASIEPQPMGGAAEQMQEQRAAAAPVEEPSGDAAVPHDSPPRILSNERLVIYLVASEEQAATMRESLVHLADTGQPPLQFKILVAGTPEQDAEAQQAIRDEQQFRHDQGLAGVLTVDVRPSSSGDTGASGDAK